MQRPCQLRLIKPTDGDDFQEVLDEWDLWMRAQSLATKTRSERRRIVLAAARAVGEHPGAFTHTGLIAWLVNVPSDTSRLTYFRAMQAWHRWLILTDRRTDDPTTKIPKPREPKRQPHPASTAGLVRLLRSGIRRKTQAMVLLGCYSGMRVHEIAKIRGEDVDRDAAQLKVKGKGGKVRYLPLHPVVAQLADTFPRRGYWFPSPKHPGRPMSGNSASDTISRAMKRAGVVGTAHSLRHWFATENLGAGANLRIVQELLGHGSVATTQLYTQVGGEQMMAAVLRLPDVTGGSA